MQVSISPQPVIALIAGILILLIPRLLSYIVAIFLIYLAFSGWSADWHSNLLLLKDYHSSGKGNEGLSLAVGDWIYLRIEEKKGRYGLELS